MPILNVRLNEDDETKLAQLMAVTRADKSTLVRKLINDQWVALQAGQTFVERRGGHPVNLLNGTGKNSLRDVRKKAMSQQFTDKAKSRKG